MIFATLLVIMNRYQCKLFKNVLNDVQTKDNGEIITKKMTFREIPRLNGRDSIVKQWYIIRCSSLASNAILSKAIDLLSDQDTPIYLSIHRTIKAFKISNLTELFWKRCLQ